MDDRDLVATLRYLGIDERNCRVIALLPLARVAWADGGVQPAEQETILKIAREGGFVDEESERVLKGWLAHAPSDTYFERGSQVIVELAKRGGALGSAIDIGTVDAIQRHCASVASAAGGLFGLAFTIDQAERAALADIAKALAIDPSDLTWNDLDDGELS